MHTCRRWPCTAAGKSTANSAQDHCSSQCLAALGTCTSANAHEVHALTQEVGSYRPAVRPERRREMQQEMVATAPNALQVLASCLNQKGDSCQPSCLCVMQRLRHDQSAQHVLLCSSSDGLLGLLWGQYSSPGSTGDNMYMVNGIGQHGDIHIVL